VFTRGKLARVAQIEPERACFMISVIAHRLFGVVIATYSEIP